METADVLLSTVKDPVKGSHDRLHHIIRALSRCGNVHVLSTNAWWVAEGAESPGDYLRTSRDSLPPNVTVEYFAQWNMPPILQELVGGAHALRAGAGPGPRLHLNYHSLVPGWILSKRFKRAHIPCIMDLADDLPSFYRESSTITPLVRGLAWRLSKVILSQLLEISDFITCTSESLARSYGIPTDKREIVPNGVDTASFHAMDVTARRRELGLQGRLVIGYVGVLREWVDLKLLLNAANTLLQHTPVTVLLIGGGPSTSEAKLLTQRNLGKAEVKITGPVPYREVPAWINLLDVGVVPFRLGRMTHNSLPMKIFEYMACGKPVVCTPLDTVKQTLGEHISYASTPSELADKVEALWLDRDTTNRLVADGLKLVRDRYDWQTIEDRLHRIYSAFLARP